ARVDHAKHATVEHHRLDRISERSLPDDLARDEAANLDDTVLRPERDAVSGQVDGERVDLAHTDHELEAHLAGPVTDHESRDAVRADRACIHEVVAGDLDV